MAQAKVTNFFSARKRNAGIQPSKRLKIQQTDAVQPVLEDLPETKVISAPIVTRTTRSSQRQNLNVAEAAKTTTTKPAGIKSAQKSTSRTRKQPKNQPGISDSLTGRSTRSSSRSSSPVGDVLESVLGKCEIGDVVTAACDDHSVSPPSSPTKRTTKNNQTVGGKRSKHGKSVRKDLLGECLGSETKPQSGYDFSKYLPKGLENESTEVRKKLVMKRRSDEHLKEKNTELDVEDQKELAPASIKPASTKESQQTADPTEKAPTEKKAVNKDKTKVESLDPAVVRARLAKSGKLAELQERLTKFSTAAAKLKEDKEVQKLADLKSEKEKANEAAKPRAPAFQRYQSLASPVPPTLNLPYKYKLLLDVFHSVDTVVSMLHKRSEVCTFSKLKNAVQVMTRKTFEEKILAQIKSVYPAAYSVRQEKGIPVPGTGVLSSWQLTVEANLDDNGQEKDCPRDKDGRPTFTATKLLERKSLFHRLLIDILKQHHTEFLSTMSRPLSVPDDKITRWHPRFQVDQVPDIVPSHLPQPPDVKKFTTASQVLEQARASNTTLNARVQKALENVAKQKKEAEARAAAAAAAAKSTNKLPEKSSPAVKETKPGVAKGIPQSLLDRIRAKEAEKTAMTMMASPADEKRAEMISRLPDVVRIIRTFFVTYKKPCMPIEDAIKKVSESAKSSMGSVEAEAHIKLLLELVPDWASVVSVRKGEYIKINRNQDTGSVIHKINSHLNKT